MTTEPQVTSSNHFDHLLAQVRIVLVEPSHPGNIGSVARAMKTMGLRHLVLVNPKKFPHDEATRLAAGAESVLSSAKVVDTAEQAIAECTMVIGTSVRDREVTWPTYDPRQTAALVDAHIRNEQAAVAGDPSAKSNLDQNSNCSSNQKVAVLFGRESSGLTNSEMDLCQTQIRISANSEYSSLNLASAVQIIAYELRMQFQQNIAIQEHIEAGGVDKRQLSATHKQKEGHIEHLQNTLESLSFIKAKSPTVLMRKLTRLYSKADLTVEEIHILRGILTSVQQQIGRADHQHKKADTE